MSAFVGHPGVSNSRTPGGLAQRYKNVSLGYYRESAVTKNRGSGAPASELLAIRRGASVRKVAKRFGVAHSTAEHWVARAVDQRLDRVDFASRRRGPRRPANKVSPEVEQLVLTLRRELKASSPLGGFGAGALHEEMLRRGAAELPSVRTIGRILERRGALNGSKRVRRPPPPRGCYLPAVAAQEAELDSFDIVEGLVIQGGYSVEVLNAISLWGGLTEWFFKKISNASLCGNTTSRPRYRRCSLTLHAGTPSNSAIAVC